MSTFFRTRQRSENRDEKTRKQRFEKPPNKILFNEPEVT
jgi:hypothetical protein